MPDARNRTFDWLAKNDFAFTPSQADHFMLDVRQPEPPVTNALAHRSTMIDRT